MTKIIPPNDLLPGPSAVLRNITHFLLKFHREYFVVVFYHDTCWYCFASTWREHATVVVASGSVIFSSRGFASGGWECCECREDDCEVKLDDHLEEKKLDWMLKSIIGFPEFFILILIVWQTAQEGDQNLHSHLFSTTGFLYFWLSSHFRENWMF